MSDQSRLAVQLRGVGKLYKLFERRRDQVLDAMGLGAVARWRGAAPRMFWALRDVDLDVPRGRRLGIVGRNGAGKSTLLKVITGALAPTEGTVHVDGTVQALFDAGSGFHPEFTGYENIHASLTYQGLDAAAIRAATADIAEFTELEEFLGQPLKAYSLGMQARLAFAVATATRPDILIVDEVLGAGDAYFASKSTERMRALVESSGATVLLVSHDTSAIMRYCDDCIWVERGRIVQRGRAMDVVNAYEAFIHEMEDRRLRARNRQRARDGGLPTGSDARLTVTVALRVEGPPGTGCDVGEVALLRDGVVEDIVRVGDVQDASNGSTSGVVLPGERWSEPRTRAGRACRTVLVADPRAGAGEARAAFSCHGSLDDGRFSLRIAYRTPDAARISATVLGDQGPLTAPTPLPSSPEWGETVLELAGTPASVSRKDAEQVVRWPSEGSLVFERAVMLDALGRERAVFEAGSPFQMRTSLVARRTGRFNVIVAASIYRLDGVFVTNLVSPATSLELSAGERAEAWLEIPRLPLGDSKYVVSLSAFEGEVTEHSRYDLVARAYEFQVTGNPPLAMRAVVQLDAQWRVGALALTTGEVE